MQPVDTSVDPSAEVVQEDGIHPFDKLLLGMTWWRDHQQMPESHGYLLRPRLRPGWVPSWLNSEKVPILSEDGAVSLVSNDNALKSHRSEILKQYYTIDAKRLSDGATIIIKRVRKDANESTIAWLISSQSTRQDPRNHCVPIFAVNEVVVYIRQTLEVSDKLYKKCSVLTNWVKGLSFMHEKGVAHR